MKKWLIALAVLLTVVLVVGCAQKAPATSEAPKSTEAQASDIEKDIAEVDSISSDLDTSEIDSLDQDLQQI
ncbi:hypothetical protein HY493_03005 [Candidatus Woesearchaeota archaeon]|nr:hypothetical protein [Candidatus Woesearchaeota archaeon]